jgi:hypothetical protein
VLPTSSAATTTKVEEDVDGGPLGVLSTGPAVTTTEVEEDIDGGPPLGVLPVGPTTTTTEVEKDIDGGPPGGVAGRSGSGHHPMLWNIDGGTEPPLGVLIPCFD